MLYNKKIILLLLSVVLVVGIGAASFFGSRELRSDDPTTFADQGGHEEEAVGHSTHPPDFETFSVPQDDGEDISENERAKLDVEAEKLLSEDRAKPRMDGFIGGIEIVPWEAGKPTYGPVPGCDGTNVREGPTEAAAGSDLAFTYPDDWELWGAYMPMCGETLAGVERHFQISPTASVHITRTPMSTPFIALDHAADRMETVTVTVREDGDATSIDRQAVHVKPVRLSNGEALTEEVLLIKEEFGLTAIFVEQESPLSALEIEEMVGW